MTDSAEGAEQLYAVVYEDGDEEDLTLAELLPLIIHRREEEEAAEMCPSNDGTVDGSVQASEQLESESSDDSASEEDVNCAKVNWEFPRDFNVTHELTENKINYEVCAILEHMPKVFFSCVGT